MSGRARRFPLMEARMRTAQRQQEVVIFITPYIWDPSMSAPMPMPGAFAPKAGDKTIRP